MVEMTRWRSLKLCLYDVCMIIVGVEEVVKAVDTVVRDNVIVSVGVIEVGETMVGKDVGKGGAVVVGEVVSVLFCCETSTFWEHFFRCNV